MSSQRSRNVSGHLAPDSQARGAALSPLLTLAPFRKRRSENRIAFYLLPWAEQSFGSFHTFLSAVATSNVPSARVIRRYNFRYLSRRTHREVDVNRVRSVEEVRALVGNLKTLAGRTVSMTGEETALHKDIYARAIPTLS